MKTISLVFALLISALTLSHADDGVLTAKPPIPLTGTKGKFDFIKVDAANRRLLACHTGNGTLDVIDIDKSALVKSIPTGAAQGVAIDQKGTRYFVSCSKPPKLVIIDSKTLEITGEVELPGPADLCATNSANVFVDSGEKSEMWCLTSNSKLLYLTKTFAGAGMEDLGFSSDSKHLVQVLKNSSTIASIPVNVVSLGNSVMSTEREISTLPAEKPHGLAMTKGDCVLIAGGTGKLVLLDLTNGKVLASCDIAPKTDEIAFDAESSRLYCASGSGTISIVFVRGDKLTPLPALTSTPGCHSIAVDPKTHSVWVAYAKDDKPCVQQFTAK